MQVGTTIKQDIESIKKRINKVETNKTVSASTKKIEIQSIQEAINDIKSNAKEEEKKQLSTLEKKLQVLKRTL